VAWLRVVESDLPERARCLCICDACVPGRRQDTARLSRVCGSVIDTASQPPHGFGGHQGMDGASVNLWLALSTTCDDDARGCRPFLKTSL
jgi:hypothetical protein